MTEGWGIWVANGLLTLVAVGTSAVFAQLRQLRIEVRHLSERLLRLETQHTEHLTRDDERFERLETDVRDVRNGTGGRAR